MLRRWRMDGSGVSEVVGTILVLLITVVLFSTIILWVFSFPTPTATGRVSFDGKLEGNVVNATWSGAYVNLTHLGGDDLTEPNTRIFLTIDGSTLTLKTRGTHFDGFSIKNYGVEGPDTTWHIGETWSYLNESILQSAQVSVMVVDLVRGVVLWDKVLLGAVGERSPIFLDKWVDADLQTPLTRDRAAEGQAWTLFAKVIDPDGDLNPQSVFAYPTFGQGSCAPAWYPLTPVGENTYRRTFTCEAQKAWDGGIVILNATDMAGHRTETRAIISVVGAGTVIVQAKGPERLTFGSELQRYDLFNKTEWENNRYDANSTRTFRKGESVVVVVASKYLPNLDLKNSFFLYDPYVTPAREIVYSDPPYSKPVTTTSVPSSHAAFTFEEFLGGFYVYTYSFSTSSADHGYDGNQMGFGHFPLIIDLKAGIVEPPRNRFWVTDTITVTDANGEVPDYPQLLFFKDPQHTQPATHFNFTETMYVVVQVKSTDGTFSVGDVMIQDALGGIQVWATPGTEPVSSAAVNNSGLDPRRYTFQVDLSKPNFDSWLLGLNSYSFRIKRVADIDEEYVGALSGQVHIQGPRWLMDIMVAMEEFSHPVFDEKVFGYFYRHDANWDRVAYELFQSTPQQPDPEFGQGPFHDIAMGDFDGDGDLDAVVGIESGGVLMYRNTRGDGTAWRRTVIDFDAGGKVLAVAAGDIDRDVDPDVAAGTDSGNLWVYKNDGSWPSTLVDSLPSAVVATKFGDVTGDGVNDLVVGTSDGRVHVYLNDGTGLFGTTVVSDFPATGETLLVGSQSGSYLDTVAEDDVYEGLTEAWTTSYVLLERVQDGVFQSNLSAWPLEVNTNTQGETAWDSVSATNDGSGSLRASNNLGVGRKFTGYRGQTLQEPIQPDSPFRLTFFYRKSWIGATPTVQRQGVVLVYADGFTHTIWSHAELRNSDAWVDVLIDGRSATGHGNLTAIRLAYDLQGPGGSSSQARVWFDGVRLQVRVAAGTTSGLEHKWVVANVGTGGTAYQFKVQAHHTSNLEGDNFVFYYSLDDVAYTRMLTVVSTADDDTYRAFVLPTSVAGKTVHVKVFDANRVDGNLGNDTLSVDHLLISRITVITPNAIRINLGSKVHDLALGDLDGDRDLDIVAGVDSSRFYVLKNAAGDGRTWTTSSFVSSGPVLSVDLADFDADGDLDLAAGTKTKNLHVYRNTDGAGGSWSGSTVESNVGEVLALAAGDIDGDYREDIVIVTEVGNVYYYRNRGSGVWTRTQIDFTEAPIFGVAIGDVDQGVIG